MEIFLFRRYCTFFWCVAYMSIFLWTCSLSLAYAGAPLDTIGGKIHKLGGVEVSAASVNADVHSAVPAQSLNQEDMKRRGVQDISDAMNCFSGITLRDYGGAGGIKTVSVRGLGASYTAVSYDGVMLSDVQTGQIDLSRFTLNGVEEIRLLVGDNFNLLQTARSAASAAGVEISTQPVALYADSSVMKNRQLHLEHGSFERYNAMLSCEERMSRKLVLGVLGDYLFAGNDYPYSLKNGLTTTKEHRNNSRMNSFHTELNAFWKIGRQEQADAKIYYYDNNHHFPGVVVFYNPYNAEKQHERNAFAQVRCLKSFGQGWTVHVLGKFNWSESKYTDNDNIYPGGALLENYWQREFYASGVLKYAPRQWWGVAYAADYSYNNLNSNQRLNENVSRQTVLQSLTTCCTLGPLNLSGRLLCSVYENEAGGVQAAKDFMRLTPSAAISLRLLRGEQFFLRTFYKDIFRVPTFTESYYSHLGNPDLNPERTHQLGMGLTFSKCLADWWPELKLLADGYQNNVRSKIVSIPISLHQWRTLNLGSVRALGADITLLSRFLLALRQQLSLSGNYTFQCVVDRTQRGGATYNKQLAYTPEHSGSMSLAYENPWLNVSFKGTGTSSRWSTHEHSHGTLLQSYMEYSMAAWRSFSVSSLPLEVRADVHNLFNKQYDIVSGYPMPGRAYRLSVNVNF